MGKYAGLLRDNIPENVWNIPKEPIENPNDPGVMNKRRVMQEGAGMPAVDNTGSTADPYGIDMSASDANATGMAVQIGQLLGETANDLFGGSNATAQQNYDRVMAGGELPSVDNTGSSADPYGVDLRDSGDLFRKYIRPTETWKIFANTKEDNLLEAKDLADTINNTFGGGYKVSPAEIVANATSLHNARAIVTDINNRKAVMGNSGTPEELKQWMLEAYPVLDKLDSVHGAILLNNIDNVKQVNNIFSAGKLGLYSYFIAEERAAIFNEHARTFKPITPEQTDRLNYLNKEAQSIREQMPSMGNAPLSRIVGDTLGQSANYTDMLVAQGIPAALGAVAAAGTFATTKSGQLAKQAGVKTFQKTQFLAQGAMMARMFNRQFGEKFYEYENLQNSKGEALLSKQEALTFAAIETGLETGIEFYNYKDVMGLLGGGGKKAIEAIVAKNAGNKEAIFASFKDVINSKSLKQFAKVNIDENLENVYQDTTDKLIHNFIVDAYRPTSKEKGYSAQDIAQGATDSFIEGIPAVLGMTGTGMAMSGIRAVRNTANAVQLQETFSKQQIENAFSMQMLKDLKSDKSVLDFFKKSPEVATEVVKQAAEKAGMPNVFVDTEMLSKQEGGIEILHNIAEAMEMPQEAIDEIIQKGGDLEVPTEVYSQVVLPTEQADQVIDMTSSQADIACTARSKEASERMRKVYQEIIEKYAKDQEEVITNIVNNNFEGEAEKRLAGIILAMGPSNPAQALEKYRTDLIAERDAILEPVIAQLNQGWGHRPTILQADELPAEWDAMNVGIRMSNNDPWYSKWYKDNKRQPTKGDLRSLAYDILTGTNEYNVPGYGYENMTDAESDRIMRESFAETKATLDKMYDDIEVLDQMRPKMSSISTVDTAIARGLSPEGYKAYQKVANILLTSDNAKVRDSAKFAAVMMARHGERMVEAGLFKTVDQYMNELVIRPNAEIKETNVQAAAQYNQINVLRDFDKNYTPVVLDNLEDKIGTVGEEELDLNKVEQFIKDLASKGETVTTEDLMAIFNVHGVGDGVTERHIARAQSQKGRVHKKVRSVRNKTLSNMQDVLSKAILIEVAPTEHKGYKNVKHNVAPTNSYRFVLPVQYKNRNYTMVITAESFENKVKPVKNPVALYEIFMKKNNTVSSENSVSATNGVGESSPVGYNIRQILQNVKGLDNQFYVNEVTGELNISDKILIDHRQNNDTFNQTADTTEETTLAVYHNISADSLNRAINVGGLQVEIYNKKDPDARLDAVRKIDKERSVFFQKEQTIQGQIALTDKGKRIISLFSSADQSTFMHESGHLFLDDLHRAASIENANEQVVKDWVTVKDWLGWKDGQEKFTVEQQEKFARAFEAYLMEGKAPVENLKKPFQRFKKWLSSIYRDFAQLGGKPSKEIENVMGRMIATQDEIDIAMKRQQIDSFSRSAGFDILDKKTQDKLLSWQEKIRQEAEEKVLVKVMADLKEEEKKTNERVMADIRAGVEEELRQEPIFQAEAALRLSNGDTGVLSVLGYNEETYKAEIAKRGGSFEAAVNMEMETYKGEITESSQDVIRARAEQAVQGAEYRDMVIALEMQALSRLGENMTREELAQIKGNIRVIRDAVVGTVKDTRIAADRALAKMPINQAINVALWQKKEQQKQQECLKAMAAGKWQEALDAKRSQLLYATMAKRSNAIQKSVNKKVERIAKQNATLDKGTQRMPAQERYYFQHIAYVLGLRNTDTQAPADLLTFRELMLKHNTIPGMEDADAEVAIPDSVTTAAAAKQQDGKNAYTKLTFEEFKETTDYLQHIYHAGLNTDNLIGVTGDEGEVLRLSDVVNDLVLSIKQNIAMPAVDDITGLTKKTSTQKFRDQVGNLFLLLVKPETLLQQIDGYESDAKGTAKTGVANRLIFDPVNKARNTELSMLETLTGKVRKIFSVYDNAEFNKVVNDRVYKYGTSLLTKEQLICLALNCGTEKNLQRVLDGYTVMEGEDVMSPTTSYNMKMAALQDALSNLTAKDWQVVTGVWQLFDSYWADNSRVEERTTGIPLGKEKAVSFKVKGKDGQNYELAGGYFPIVYDPTKSVKAASNSEMDVAKSKMPGNARLGMGRSFTKKRSETVSNRPIALGFNVINKKLSDEVHNIAFREVVRDVNRIINNPDFQSQYIQATDMDHYRVLQKWARDVWAEELPEKSAFEKLAAVLRSRQTMAVLGWRTSTAIMNMVNLPIMIGYCGANNFASAYKDFLKMPKSNINFIQELSPFMKDRSETMDNNMGEYMREKHGKVKASTYDWVQENAFKIIGFTDNMFAYPLWLSEYKKVVNEGMQKGWGEVKTREEAIAAGDRAVRRVIGSGEVKDRAPIQKGGEFTKMLTMYYTFFSALINLQINKYNASHQQQKIDSKTAIKAFMPFAHGLLFYFMLPAALETVMRGALAGDTGDDKTPEWYASRYPRTLAENFIGGLPIARDVVKAIMDTFAGGYTAGDVKLTSAYDIFSKFKTLASKASKVSDPKSKVDYIDVARASAKVFNSVAGTPDTLTDAMTTFMRYSANKFDNDVYAYILATLMDRSLPKTRDKRGRKLPKKDKK